MSDRLKFRAWVTESEDEPCMVYQGSNEPYTMVSNGDGFGVVSNMETWLSDDKFTIMQCTGLKDKNGVVIYEGDIIQRSNSSTFHLVVKWDDVDGKWFCQTNSAFSNNRLTIKRGVCIGNIYENPELLEQ